ncbi:permease [Sporolactobacillus laevolacticus]|uniref:permease n=1 Tax=Sporolactobacillus laevolacticus TaxID=33018 RepID=UPI0025B5ABA1|nr:permease [Sporolactobacillus laevolacticus]MDN3954561.1 permease [Sporolactobacillus laevolacticus]
MFWNIIQSFLSIALELTLLFIGISFLISLIQGFIPYEKMNRYLSGRNTALGVLVALILAFITPFCSCSTIPVIVNLLKEKVRFGIVMVFLFSSPVLDPTIITLMGALLGVKVAVTYTVITSILSVIIGLLLEKLGFEKSVKQVIMTGYEVNEQKFSLKKAFRETIELMKSVYPYLIIGAAIGSMIHGAVPTEWISSVFGGNQWWLVPVAAIIGIPLYIRLSMMIPMSQILILKGMAVAPVMALMISSAGASLPELTLLQSIFHKRLVIAFVVSVFAMSTISGFLFYLI